MSNNLFVKLCSLLFFTLLFSCTTQRVPPKIIAKLAIENPTVVMTEPAPITTTSLLVEINKKAVPKEVPTIDEETYIAEEHEEVPEYSEKVINLAEKIIVWKKKIDHNLWWECGVKYDKEGIRIAAYEWSQVLIDAQEKTTYELRWGWRKGEVRKINMAEAVGIIINESRFDRCAVGPYPRKFAYKKGILQRARGWISHSLEELEVVFKHPKFKGRLADLGAGQIVVRVPKNMDKDSRWSFVKEYLSLVPGVQKLFDELAYRGNLYNTTKPSSRWPGSRNHKWYTLSVYKQAYPLFHGVKRR